MQMLCTGMTNLCSQHQLLFNMLQNCCRQVSCSERRMYWWFSYSVLERGDHGMEGQTKWIPILDSIKKQSEDQRSVRDELLQPMKAYNAYKTGYMKNIQFDNDAKNQCKCNDRDHSKLFNHVSWSSIHCLFSAFIPPPNELQVVEIYFDASTFDEIERDVKRSRLNWTCLRQIYVISLRFP